MLLYNCQILIIHQKIQIFKKKKNLKSAKYVKKHTQKINIPRQGGEFQYTVEFLYVKPSTTVVMYNSVHKLLSFTALTIISVTQGQIMPYFGK